MILVHILNIALFCCNSQPGWYVIVHVQDVPRHLYDSQVTSQAPLVLFGLLPHEQKMSVMNVVIKSHPLGHYRPIKSKERLIFHIGFRRFANCPIFSEHSTGNKHKVSPVLLSRYRARHLTKIRKYSHG